MNPHELQKKTTMNSLAQEGYISTPALLESGGFSPDDDVKVTVHFSGVST